MEMKPRVLLVDDDEAILKQVRWAFNGEYEVETSRGEREEVLELVRVFRPQVVGLDINLSGSREGREGLELLNEILKEDNLAKVVIITANESRDNAIAAIRSGAFDFYVKPIDIEELKIIFTRAVHIREIEESIKKQRLPGDVSFAGLIGCSPQMQRVFNLIEVVSQSDFTVLITGESGTGKELVARAIHNLSQRKERPFVVVNCGAIPESLLESELFGYKKGAFTGAVSNKKGRFELANHGTLFLDEIGELPLSLQVKLLRVLQDKIIQPVGSDQDVPLDIRIIAATNADLRKKVKEGSFREDLFYRLNVINIEMPSLRERGDDILLLAQYFVDKFSNQVGKKVLAISEEAIEKLSSYHWPGNVRELENTMLRAVVMCDSTIIKANHIFLERLEEMKSDMFPLPDSLKKAKEKVERELVLRALEKTDWNISLSAKILEISRTQLYQLIDKYELKEV